MTLPVPTPPVPHLIDQHHRRTSLEPCPMTLTSTATIPVIDFGPFLQGEESDRDRVAQEIYQACSTIGFMYLRNHGIPVELLQQLLAQAQAFFQLPLDLKETVARSPDTNCGYIAVQTERLDPGQPWDLKEAFNMGLEVVWPPEPVTFQPVVSEFYRCCTEQVAPNVLRAFAMALDLPHHYFDDKHGRNYFLRMLHYPPVDQQPQPGQLRAGAHTDYGSITLLLQDDIGGLEVQTRDGQWVAAPPIPGTVVVNVGDAMQRWTNDRLSSTRHRVAVPTGDDAGRSRYSVALFCDPNPEVLIDCLPQCITSDRPRRYPPILMRDHLLSKLTATY